MHKKNDPRVVRHFLSYRLISIFGTLYFLALVVATFLFYKMMSEKFQHPIFWTWCFWTFITSYSFFVFMRVLLNPVVQIYQNQVILTHPKRRLIMKEDLKTLTVKDNQVHVTFMENGGLVSVTIPVRENIVREPFYDDH